MTIQLPTLVATSVVRGSQQGESHGGVYTVDFARQSGRRHIDWNTGEIDFEGRGADRGLRGIAFNGDDVYIAASDELYCYDRGFSMQSSWRNRYLKHCHEICRKENRLFLTSTGFDSLLAFNLDTRQFDWGFQVTRIYGDWSGHTFDPRRDTGPAPSNEFHINMVQVDDTGIFVSGLHTQALLHISNNGQVAEVCNLPAGTHNARLWCDGVVFNDTQSDCVRHVRRDGAQQAFAVPRYAESAIAFAGVDDTRVARQAFGRGLATVGDRFIAAGSSPSTITLYDVESGERVGSVNLSMDIRNAIHGLEVWPWESPGVAR